MLKNITDSVYVRVIRNTQVLFFVFVSCYFFWYLYFIRKKKCFTTQKIAHEKNIFTLGPRRLLTQTNPCNAMKNIDSHIKCCIIHIPEKHVLFVHTFNINEKERDFTNVHTDFSPFINIRGISSLTSCTTRSSKFLRKFSYNMCQHVAILHTKQKQT